MTKISMVDLDGEVLKKLETLELVGPSPDADKTEDNYGTLRSF